MKYGFTGDLGFGKLRRRLKTLSKKESLDIRPVIGPYLDSISARLDTLDEIAKLAQIFVGILNEFYTGKYVELNIRTGLIVKTKIGEVIDPEFLSSGEKQLLLLLCTAISSRNSVSTIIIDEPELSLNPKWQRQLVNGILSLMEDDSQLIMATHSIELLSRYKHCVFLLKDHE
jgi:ABC-type glutathione transport system ATPase component